MTQTIRDGSRAARRYEVEHFSTVLRYNGETMHGRTASACRAPR